MEDSQYISCNSCICNLANAATALQLDLITVLYFHNTAYNIYIYNTVNHILTLYDIMSVKQYGSKKPAELGNVGYFSHQYN